jgi:creatinine amidohydrolase
MIHDFIPPQRFLPYLSWTEVAALPDRENTVIVLPVGAINSMVHTCPRLWTV